LLELLVDIIALRRKHNRVRARPRELPYLRRARVRIAADGKLVCEQRP
jgi:hypothetical protein